MFNNDILIYDKVNHRWIQDPQSWELGELQLSGIVTCHNTGILDYYHTRIYEYNIVQTYNDDNTIHSTFYIKYIPAQCKFNIDTNLVQAKRLKVIGNVFNHTYLLPAKYHTKLEQELGFKLYTTKILTKQKEI